MFENSLRYNHTGEWRAIERTRDYYDSLVIPAHHAVTKADDIAGLLNNQIGSDVEYYIDPVLPRYRKGDGFRTEEGDLSKWHQLLVDRYGDPISRILNEQRNLSLLDLDDSERRSVVQTQCELQLELIEEAGEDKLAKYFDVETELRPRAVVPWYIKITRPENIALNEQIINIASESVEAPIKPCIFVSLTALNRSEIRREIVKMLERVGVEEAFLWFEEMGKREAEIMDYAAASELIYSLSQNGVSPHFFYGNYFAQLTSYLGNEGTTFGVAYQESRAERTAVGDNGGGGGDGANRYYFDPVKEFLNFQEAESLGDQFDVPICSCPACQERMDQWADVYKFDGNYNAQRRHYIWNQDRYRDDIESKTLEEQLDDLETAHEKYDSELSNSGTAAEPHHLIKWRGGISHFVEHELGKEPSEIEQTLA